MNDPDPQHNEPPPNANINVNQQANDVKGKQIGVEIEGDVGTVTTGFSAQAVQRLILTVGVFVFVTAACFFSGGIIVGIGAFAALNRPVATSASDAQDMQNKFSAINNLRPGQAFNLTFSEEDLSSYVRFVLGPQLGMQDGSARLLDDTGRLIIAGTQNGVRTRATFKLDTGDEPLKLEAAAVQVLPLGSSPFGWVAVPNAVAESSVGKFEDQLFKNVRFTSIKRTGNTSTREWTVTGVKK